MPLFILKICFARGNLNGRYINTPFFIPAYAVLPKTLPVGNICFTPGIYDNRTVRA